MNDLNKRYIALVEEINNLEHCPGGTTSELLVCRHRRMRTAMVSARIFKSFFCKEMCQLKEHIEMDRYKSKKIDISC